MDRFARRYSVEGRVQGVGFRWFVARAAQAVGVKGWARNLADGRVEVYGIGSKEQLGRFAALLRRGPDRAEVTKLEESEASIEKLEGFEIR